MKGRVWKKESAHGPKSAGSRTKLNGTAQGTMKLHVRVRMGFGKATTGDYSATMKNRKNGKRRRPVKAKDKMEGWRDMQLEKYFNDILINGW